MARESANVLLIIVRSNVRAFSSESPHQRTARLKLKDFLRWPLLSSILRAPLQCSRVCSYTEKVFSAATTSVQNARLESRQVKINALMNVSVARWEAQLK
jgi:hypothetical protein